MTSNPRNLAIRRRNRVRSKLRRVAKSERPRLSVFRSGRHIYAQIIDDKQGRTLVSASSADKEFKIGKGWNVDGASEVGKLIAGRAKEAGVSDVVFDRGPYLFHGRVKALAEAARESGLNF
ncbi:MAG: 50S ribosomal protein L18 [Alphaproteobacteria bacterium]|jgi:large subunit ribosomal protein L18|nr:50S ribosomal protein L18 [Alphaproteobacteria bacterium]